MMLVAQNSGDRVRRNVCEAYRTVQRVWGASREAAGTWWIGMRCGCKDMLERAEMRRRLWSENAWHTYQRAQERKEDWRYV